MAALRLSTNQDAHKSLHGSKTAQLYHSWSEA